MKFTKIKNAFSIALIEIMNLWNVTLAVTYLFPLFLPYKIFFKIPVSNTSLKHQSTTIIHTKYKTTCQAFLDLIIWLHYGLHPSQACLNSLNQR